MALAVPVAVRFLQGGNRDLSRNMSSYLSLAAMAEADLLAEHTEAITLSVLAGRRSSSPWQRICSRPAWFLSRTPTAWDVQNLQLLQSTEPQQEEEEEEFQESTSSPPPPGSLFLFYCYIWTLVTFWRENMIHGFWLQLPVAEWLGSSFTGG